MQMMNDSPDTEVLAQSVAQPEAFAVIYQRHADRVLRYLRRRLGDAAAEDAAVEVFVRAFKQRGQYASQHPTALPWLYWLAGLVIADHARAERRRLKLLARLTQTTRTSATEQDGFAVMAPELVRALRKLRPELRETLLLVVWGELSYEEAAATLQIPVGTVRSRIARARQQLRSQLPVATLAALQLAHHVGEAHA